MEPVQHQPDTPHPGDPLASDQPPPEPPKPEKKPLTIRRFRRKLWRIFLFTLAALLLAVLVVTRTGALGAILIPRLESALGAEIEAGSVVITPDLSILLRDITLRVPGIAGEGGELFTAERMMIDLDWSKLPAPESLKTIELESPMLRVSQDTETGAVNATQLGIFAAKGPAGAIAVPTVIVRNGIIKLGEHTTAGIPTESSPTGYAPLADFPVSGLLAPQPGGTSSRSLFSLTRRAGESGLEITGFIDPDGVTFTVGGVDLNDWPASAIPTRFRSLYERLHLQGRIVPRTITVGVDGEVEINVDLQSVALTLPFTAENARSKEPVRLTEVMGRLFVSEDRVSADLSGKADALTQRVQFDLFGFDPRTSPFVARLVTPKLRWERDIALLDYVPPAVIEQTDRFGQPEADVEAVIWLARRISQIPPGKGLLAGFRKPADLNEADNPDAVRLSGALAMRNGTAAFRGFPYTFHQLSVDFRFNTARLLVENVDGISDSGAHLTGGGWISPLGETSAVELEFSVTDLVIDDALLGALNPARRQLVDVLFNQEKYAELIQAGLIRTPADDKPINDRLDAIANERAAWIAAGGIAPAELERLAREEADLRAQRAATPVFELGGTASVDMRFVRQEGIVSIWSRDIRLGFPTVGFLTEMFPMPAIGQDVRVTIGEDELRLTVDKGRAISGGSVTIQAVMDTSDAARAAAPDGNTLPTVRVRARDIPIEPLLIRAVAGPNPPNDQPADQADDQTAGPIKLADLLARLGLNGVVDSDADIVPNQGNLDYTIRATMRDLTANIAEAGTRMRAGSGTALVDRRTVTLDITGGLIHPETGAAAQAVSINAHIALPPGSSWGDGRRSGPAADPSSSPRIDATIALSSADITLPAEPIVGIFDRTAAGKLADLRAKYNPKGTLDASTTIRGPLGPGFAQQAEISVALSDITRLDFDYEGLRLAAQRSRGNTIILLGDDPRAAFDAFSVDIATVDASGTPAPAGRLSILETLRIGEAFATTPISIELDAGRFESPLTRRSIERLPTLLSLADTYQPRGLFDLTLRRRPDGRYEGQARPQQVTVNTPRGDIGFTTATGAITFGPTTGTFDDIALANPQTTLAFDGAWTIGADGTDITLQIDAQTEGLPQPLVGLAPQTIGEIFDALDIAVDGTTAIEGLNLSMRAIPGGLFADVGATGATRFTNASLAVGVPVTELSGLVRFDATRPDPTIPARFTLDIDADRARLMGLRVTNARARLVTGTEPGSVLVPEFGADAHGGRITATVRLSPALNITPDRPAGERQYWTDLQLAEVRIAPLLEDVRVTPDQTLADRVREALGARADDVWNQAEDRSRGLLSANMSLTGTVGETVGRRGRGRVIAGGGPVLQLPLLTRVIEFANLQLPVGDELGLAYANLFMDGDRVSFENFAVLSRNVEIQGVGDMTLPGGELDFRVRSRALNRIPVLTQVVESFRDELFSTRIAGTITAPVVSNITLEETRRVLGSLLGAQQQRDDRLREISARESDARQRIREAGALLQRSGEGAVSPTRRGDNDAP